jgi:hypothetical protein
VVRITLFALSVAVILASCSTALSRPSSEPSPESTPVATLAGSQVPLVRFEGEGFSFEYPDSWQLISGYQHFGEHGPTVLAAVGIGDFDPGCTVSENSVSCSSPRWAVPSDGVVLAYHIRPWLGPIAPQPTPSLGPHDEWVDVGGRAAVLTRTDASMTWQLPEAPEFIEARWGSDAASQAPDLIENVVGSWRWEAPDTTDE